VLSRLIDQLRRTFTDHKIYGNHAADIPEPMFRQLAREGLYRAKVFYGGMAAFILLPNLGRIDHLQLAEIPMLAIVAALWAVVAYYCWPWLTMQGVERELLYRRREGKWRWEQ
jgi:hypothetical protein